MIVVSLIVLVVSVSMGSGGNAVTNFFGSIYAAVERPLSKVSGGISDNISGIFSYKDIQEENQQLKEENEKLKQQITSLTLSANELQELEELSKVLNYNGISGTDDIVSADVISMDGTNWMNAGSENGIKEGDVVICGDGLVGRISSVGRNWAKVISIIDESSKISFKVSGNLKLIGIVESSSDGELSGFMLDDQAKVSEGDKIITSGMGTYPAGITIGKITKVKYDSNAQLQRVDIKSSVDFMSLQKVSVIL